MIIEVRDPRPCRKSRRSRSAPSLKASTGQGGLDRIYTSLTVRGRREAPILNSLKIADALGESLEVLF